MSVVDDDEVVAQYLQALEAARAAPDGFLDPDGSAAALAGAPMVAGDDEEALETQLGEWTPGSKANIRKWEAEFVRVAAAYSARHGTTYDSWIQSGVAADVLARAGIERRAR
jgi:hypothetical protein